MKRTISILAPILCAIVLLTACTKKPAAKTTCSSTWHAYTTPSWAGLPYQASHHGIVNPSTGLISSSGSFMSSPVFTVQGAFNKSDNSYYLLQGDSLFKFDLTGMVTVFAPADTSHHCYSIVYNGFNNQLYCIMYASGSATLASVSMSGGNYAASPVATPVHAFAYQLFAPSNIAVDNGTGALYINTVSLSTYYVEKYQLGTSGTSIVASASLPHPVLELRYDKNNGKLYAITMNADTSSYDFLKVDPSAGSITSVANIGKFINCDLYSASLDPCTDHYVIATTINVPGRSTVVELNLGGAVVHSDTVSSMYQALTITD